MSQMPRSGSSKVKVMRTQEAQKNGRLEESTIRYQNKELLIQELHSSFSNRVRGSGLLRLLSSGLRLSALGHWWLECYRCLSLEHGVRGLLRQGQYGLGFRVLRLLGGSGVVISRVISRVTILITQISGHITLLITTPEPQS